MKKTTAGVYEIDYTAEDDCGNETKEAREVLVAREIQAGDNITLEQDGNAVTVNADVCGALDDCDKITELETAVNGKQDALTAGENITIENGVISAQGGDLTNYYNKSETNDLLDDKVDKVQGKGLSANDFTDADKQKLDGLKNYTAGENVTIDANGEISATDTKYTAGDNITIENDVISADDPDLSDYYTKTETNDLLDNKQGTLTAGDNISISNNVISADDPDLSDYYTKTETYDKSEVDSLVNAIVVGEFVVVQELPETGEPKNIYLVPKQGEGYTEHIYVNGAWEEIGDTDIDLSPYYTKTETDDLLAGKVDKVSGKGLSTNDYTNEDKAIVDSVSITYATKDEISAFLSCDTLGSCQTISDMQDEIDGKQDTLTAGSHITIAQDGTISAEGMTRAEILAELGYNEIPMSTKDTNNVETKVMVLGRVVE